MVEELTIWDFVKYPFLKGLLYCVLISKLVFAIGGFTVHVFLDYRYVDDIPATEGELFAGFVLSSCAHGTFTLDTSPLDRIEV